MTKKGSRRFESEVHLGLLVIVCILLFLNFTSNVIIYRARESKRNSLTADLNSAARAVTRMVQGTIPSSLTESQKRNLMLQYGLSGLMVIPSKPPDNSAESRRRWFAFVVHSLHPVQIPDLARKLLTSDFHTLTRGEENEYFYVYPMPSGAGKSLAILSKNTPELAYLDDSARVVLIIGIVSVLAIAGIYLLLSRFIFSPFRKIKKQALDAGRIVDQTADDVEAMVEDYRKIISELKEKEAKLRQLNEAIQRKADSLEQFSQYLLTSMNSGIVTVDRQGRILSINRAAGEILAVQASGYEGKSYTELLKPDSELTETVGQALSQGENIDYREIDFTPGHRHKLTLGVSVSVICNNRQRPIGASLLINDLTELRRLRAELETKNRLAALGEMAGGLAHQLRNSMGAITGYCALLKKRLKRSGIEIGSVAALVQETTETEKLVERFLQFARPLAFTPQLVSVNELIAQVIDSFHARLDCQQAEFVVKQAGDIMVELDTLLIKQALTNIIENAVNAYENRKGLVELRVSLGAPPLWSGISQESSPSKPTAGQRPGPRRASDGPPILQLQIEVEDSGCGISEEDLDKIFTPFFSSRPSGTGLGLPLARKIIDLHQGSLTVISQWGKGTTFTILLPVQVPAVIN